MNDLLLKQLVEANLTLTNITNFSNADLYSFGPFLFNS